MKELNEKSDFIIKYELEPIDTKGKKEGDILRHRKVVCELFGYQQHTESGYIKVWHSKEDILSLAEQIKRIESESVDKPWDKNLPF